MSRWVYLRDRVTNDPVVVPIHSEGGTFVLGGTTTAELNITYNYGIHFRTAVAPDHGIGLQALDGLSGKAAIPILRAAIEKLGGDHPDPDYWKPTPGNAAHALNIMLEWSEAKPEGVWEIGQ